MYMKILLLKNEKFLSGLSQFRLKQRSEYFLINWITDKNDHKKWADYHHKTFSDVSQ